MAQNMYRVGDYVYFETYPSAPYQIRRIDELNKTSTGTVEAKVTCFYRRRDLPVSLLKIADQAERQDQILWRPRRCLLAHPLASTSNGDVKTEIKENGVDNSHKSSPEPNSESNDSSAQEANENDEKKSTRSFGFAGLPLGADKLPAEQIHALRQRELFLSRQSETLPATQIRGKCAVVILNEIETCDMYLDREDAFFYSLVYDPANQTLLADKGKIEVGERHQADIPDLVQSASSSHDGFNNNGNDENHLNDDADENKENGKLMMVEEDEEEEIDVKPAAQVNGTKQTDCDIPVTDREYVVYHPHHSLTDRDIDQFLIIARAVGTFSRALDSSSSMRIPSLHMTASAASRDVTLLHAMALLHQAHYDIGQATKYLVPPPDREHYPLEADKVTGHNTVNLGGPILCRDQLEEWSAAEATLFEDAIEKYGKDFHDIRVDCLPWKSVRDIVEYYYMWKTTARYTEMQKNKLAEQEKLLKQVYIPSYNKANPNLIGAPNPSQEPMKSPTPCESCTTDSSTQWFTWGPAHLQLRLCNDCWIVWKKRGGLKCEHEYENYDLDGVAEASLQQTQSNTVTGSGGLRHSNSGTTGNRTVPSNRNNSINVTAGAPAVGRPGGIANVSAKGNLLQIQNSNVPQHFNQNAPQNHYMVGARGRVTFFLNTTLQARIARRLAPKQILNMRKAARTPFRLIDGKAIQTYYFNRSLNEVLRVARQVRRGRMSMTAIEYLTKLHAKNAPNNGAAATAAAAFSLAQGRR